MKRESGDEVVMAPPFTSLQDINSTNPEENYAVVVARKAAECKPNIAYIEADIDGTIYSVEGSSQEQEEVRAKADAYKLMHVAWALNNQTNVKSILLVKKANTDYCHLTDIFTCPSRSIGDNVCLSVCSFRLPLRVNSLQLTTCDNSDNL